MPPSKSAILRTPAKLERPLDRIFFFIIISFPCYFSKQATGKSLSLIPEKAGKGTLEKLTTKKQRNCCQELCQMKKKKKTILIIARHLHGWKQSGAISLCWHISLFLGTMKHTRRHTKLLARFILWPAIHISISIQIAELKCILV